MKASFNDCLESPDPPPSLRSAVDHGTDIRRACEELGFKSSSDCFIQALPDERSKHLPTCVLQLTSAWMSGMHARVASMSSYSLSVRPAKLVRRSFRSASGSSRNSCRPLTFCLTVVGMAKEWKGGGGKGGRRDREVGNEMTDKIKEGGEVASKIEDGERNRKQD